MKLKTFVLLAAFPVIASAGEQMFLSGQTVVNAQTDHSLLGTVSVLTPVEVIEKSGDFSKIKISGWSLKEYPSQIFKEPGVRIEYASFDEESAVKPLPNGQEKTVQDNPWIQTYADGWVKNSTLTPDGSKLLAQGKEDFQQGCGTCHPAPEPSHFTANQWASQLPLKGGRDGHSRAKGNALLFKYLQLNAKSE